MPDIYAQITAADPTTLERLAAALELRAADLLQRGILQAFVAEMALPERANVLEIGCGTGAITRFLASLPHVAQALGVDPCPVFISKARELAGQLRNLTFRVGDGRALDNEDRSFDTVLFHTALCHLPDPEKALAEALRVLRPGGSLAIFDGDYASMSVAMGTFDPLQCCADAVVDGLVHDRWLMRLTRRAAEPRLPTTAISQLRLHLNSRTELHVHDCGSRGRPSAERRTDRVGDG
jgi:SAM-dependent methyltransferase